MSTKVLKAVGPHLDLDSEPAAFHNLDGIIIEAMGDIFEAVDGGNHTQLLYGTLIESAWDRDAMEMLFMVALAPQLPTDDPRAYPLVLVYERSLLLPEYIVDEEIKETEGVGGSSVRTIVEERNVVVDAERKPTYTYRYRHEVHEGQMEMTEEEVKAIEEGH